MYTIHYSINDRKFLTKSEDINISLRRWGLTNEEKWEFVRTSVSWISRKDKMDSCFIFNFGYEAALPWPQVYISLFLGSGAFSGALPSGSPLHIPIQDLTRPEMLSMKN